MQPRKRSELPPSSTAHGAKVVASYTVGDAGVVTSAPAQGLPALFEGRVQSGGSMGPFVEWSGSAGPVMARVFWMHQMLDWGRCVGLRVALAFEGGDEARPIVVGLLDTPPGEALALLPVPEPPALPQPPAPAKPEILHIEAGRELRIECGKASILLRADGKLELRGEYLISRATGPNKIKGGSVQIN